MEKYSQYRDRGSGISPFIPNNNPSSTLTLILHTFIFLFRLPLFLFFATVYFLILTHLPLPLFVRKVLLWGMLGIPGIWWVDLQLDGVKRGSLSSQPVARVPGPNSIIAASFTSPIDALYLATIFDPIFVASFPHTRKVQRISLQRASLLALAPVKQQLDAPYPKQLTTIRAIMEANPNRAVVVFPECTTTNGKGVMPLSPSLLASPSDNNIFPVSIRYTPNDITTPIPGAWTTFLWNLLSRPTNCIRVRIAEPVQNKPNEPNGVNHQPGESSSSSSSAASEDGETPTREEQRILDKIGEALARLARNKRVGLTLRDKAAFVEAWNKNRR
ncbi:uncharacterized protein BCR38DRAFT_330026 [Pseudomassariella vexata]|uniref:Phospholipid/glycerol acyltransferase domain-containing protein n=1 Tax=Pseudomassariella vexata TaxID=1141098 RepID=A0A1Y2EHG8_9PEZI|nr:uncharacterized protein BCR38DRAFT_330026 [Pseudomassariella vexata]ORY71008.1 hypothetical protein BCR38DRAFT_330026 [Pseudomassariella vexata]